MPHTYQNSEFEDRFYDTPIINGVALRRDRKGIFYTNIRHFAIEHCAEGFAFGPVGTDTPRAAADDLALNMLHAALMALGHRGPQCGCLDGQCYELAYRLHRQARHDLLDHLSNKRGASHVIPFRRLVEWLHHAAPHQVVSAEQWLAMKEARQAPAGRVIEF